MTITTSIPQSGYDVPLYGLDNGSFYFIHIPALVCILASFVCVVAVLVLSFKAQSYRTFFTEWCISERFIVYSAICDGSFNLSHFTDHLYTTIVKDNVRPKELCEFYGFILAVFVTAQILMVNCIAVNAYLLIAFDKRLNFGGYDWKLLLWIFGAPIVEMTVAAAVGVLGPTGVFCLFDAIKGNIVKIFFTTVPLLVILVVNIILYILIWKIIHDQSKVPMSRLQHASHRAAKRMTLFVLAFFVQWWAVAVFGVSGLVGEIPQVVFHFVVIFSNIGGVLNLVVYLVIKRRRSLNTERRTNKAAKYLSDQPNGHKYHKHENPNTHELHVATFSISMHDLSRSESPNMC